MINQEYNQLKCKVCGKQAEVNKLLTGRGVDIYCEEHLPD